MNTPPQYASPSANVVTPATANGELTVMEGLTPRLQRLRNRYLEARPSVSIYRALAFTEIARNNPGLPLFYCVLKLSAVLVKPHLS